MKILVIGFQRSGTTLLKDLIWKHPDVSHMFHEVALMKHPKRFLMANRYLPDKLIKNNYQGTRSYQYEVKFNRSKANWGEKIPYWIPRIHKGFSKSVGKYCLTWNQYFGKKACILNIIRHPLDVGISTKNRGFTKGVGRPIKQYKSTMPIVLRQLETHNITNIMHVQFEMLVTEPVETLRRIYEFCNLRNGKKAINRVINNKNIFRFRKINPDRAFSYEEEGKNPEKYSLDNTMKLLNSLEGIEY